MMKKIIKNKKHEQRIKRQKELDKKYNMKDADERLRKYMEASRGRFIELLNDKRLHELWDEYVKGQLENG